MAITNSPALLRTLTVVPVKNRGRFRTAVNYVRHRGLQPDDVFLASYPKSGNTWLKFMLCELITGGDVNFETCEQIIPHVGRHGTGARLPSGARIIKTHEKFRDEYKRAIYIVRDGRDVAVSYYHQIVRTWPAGRVGGFSDFLRRFVAGEIDNVGPWHDNVMSWMRARHDREIEIVKYEDCLDDTEQVMRRLARFVGMNPSGEQLRSIIRRNGKDMMRRKERPATSADDVASNGYFVRKGVAGDWRAHYSAEDSELFLSRAGETLAVLGYAG